MRCITAPSRLRAAGIDNPRLEARLLLAHALGTDAAALLRDQDSAVDASATTTLLLSRARAREPLASSSATASSGASISRSRRRR